MKPDTSKNVSVKRDVPQHFINKARLCSPSRSAVVKGSLEIQKRVKQFRPAIMFQKPKPKAQAQGFNSQSLASGRISHQHRREKRKAAVLSRNVTSPVSVCSFLVPGKGLTELITVSYFTYTSFKCLAMIGSHNRQRIYLLENKAII